jgi:hypothetical protein
MAERIPDALRRMAQERLQQREGVENLRVGRTEVDEIPSTGSKVYSVDAFQAEDPNGRRYEIVLDEEGEEVDLAALAEGEDKEFFARAPFEPGPPRPVAAPAASIMIEPTEDIMVLNLGDTFQEIVTVTVPPNVGVSKVDVYFLADTTGSMSGIISAVQTGANNILNTLITSFPALDMAFGVGNYKDFPTDPFAFEHQLAPTATSGDVTNAINAWSADGGSDTPEGQLFALDQLAEAPGGAIGWRSDAKRIIVWFGDAPGHDPVCAAISGLASDVTEASVTMKLDAQDISVIAISTDTGTLGALDGDPTLGATDYVSACGPPGGSPGQATRITTATGGTHVVGIDETTIVDTIIDLVSSAAQTINNLNLVPTGSAAPFVVSITPAGGYGPLSGTTEHELPFTVDFRGVEPCAEEDRVFDGFLEAIADGVVVARKRVQITVPACEPELYSYSVKFVCGVQDEDPPDRRCLPGVRPGIYATEINIHNYHDQPVSLEKFVLPLVLTGSPRGREPDLVTAQAKDRINLPPNSATMDDCCRIAELLLGSPAPGRLPLAIGLLEIVSPVELHVTAVYTATNTRGVPSVSIDVEQIAGKLKGKPR